MSYLETAGVRQQQRSPWKLNPEENGVPPFKDFWGGNKMEDVKHLNIY